MIADIAVLGFVPLVMVWFLLGLEGCAESVQAAMVLNGCAMTIARLVSAMDIFNSC